MSSTNGTDGSTWYEAFGHRIHTNVPVPELGRSPVGTGDVGEADRLGTVHLEFEQTPEIAEEEGAPYWADAGTDRLHLVYPRFAELWVNERGVRIQYPSSELLPAVRALAAGVGLGSLWHLRGHLVLHASAVTFGSGAVGFLGPTGSGKSTVSTVLTNRGGSFFTDDLLLVPRGALLEDAENPIRLPRGSGVVRLAENPEWEGPEGPRGENWEPVTNAEGSGKHFFRRDQRSVPSWANLEAVCLLDTEEHVTVTRLLGADRVAAMVANSYAAEVLSVTDQADRHLEQCAHLARRTDVYRLGRPLDGRPETSEEVLECVRALL